MKFIRLTSLVAVFILGLGLIACSKNENSIDNTTNDSQSYKENEDIQKDNKKQSLDNDVDYKQNSLGAFTPNKNISSGKILSDISYSSENNPKELTMDESIEYIKDNLSEDLSEVERTYEEEVGVTSIMYISNGKRYQVRYIHPKETSSELYDVNKTIGIEVKELI